MLSVLANFKIDSKEKLLHLQKSFYSFNTISDNWVINIRGKYRKDAGNFLKSKLRKKLILFELLDDAKGWSTNTLQMLASVRHNYILLWNEDHCNVVKQEKYFHILEELKREKVDYLLYSWWDFGESRKAFGTVALQKGKYLDSVLLTKNIWKKVRNNAHNYYVVSLIGIFSKSFLKKLLIKDNHYYPYSFTTKLLWLVGIFHSLGFKIEERNRFELINNIFFFNLRKYPKETPFNLEMEPYRQDVLPFKFGIPKEELFVCIDDSHGYDNYSLIQRGLFPFQKDEKLNNI